MAKRYRTDKFAACREFFGIFNDACSNAVRADDYITIDETLYKSRTRCSFQKYNKNKNKLAK